MSRTSLGKRFADLWRRAGAATDAGKVFDELVQAYEEPHRRYHGMSHLRHCLAELDGAPPEGVDTSLAEAALWFHDIVYAPAAPDNELRSADRAAGALLDAAAPEARAREVARLIRLTDHARPADDPLGALVCDVDLSILGRPPGEFAEYENGIRAEYRSVPEQVYRAGRTSMLARLLARDRIYRTEHFLKAYESTARRNLIDSIGRLGQEGTAE
jgi:predicted metal-dependent HD superfamily phosphohydrolase